MYTFSFSQKQNYVLTWTHAHISFLITYLFTSHIPFFLLYHPSSSSCSLSITSYLDHFIYAFQPWHVTSYLFCGCDLVKIMRNELFDQNLLTTRHRGGPDKPWPHLSALFQLWSRHLSILIHLFVDAMIHLLFYLLSKKKSFFSCTGMLLIMKFNYDEPNTPRK